MTKSDQINGARLSELLASFEHERWAHWQKYLHSRCLKQDDGSLIIPSDLVSRWEKQISTPYEELSESERQSDRDQVERAVSALLSFLKNHS